jgi:hypothetical protein
VAQQPLSTNKIERTMIMKAGFAQIPLERYDELMSLAQAVKSSFKIEGDYRNEPALKFDYRNFLGIIEDLLAETKYASKYRVKDVGSLYAETIFGVFERIPEDDEDQA